MLPPENSDSQSVLLTTVKDWLILPNHQKNEGRTSKILQFSTCIHAFSLQTQRKKKEK